MGAESARIPPRQRLLTARATSVTIKLHPYSMGRIAGAQEAYRQPGKEQT